MSKPMRRNAIHPVLQVLEDRLAPATLTVNSVANADMRDTVLTLREAIRLASGTLSVAQLTADEQAQVSGTLVAAPNRDVIRFHIGPGTQTIAPTGTDLPEVAEPAEIDGTAPTAFPSQRIEISGQNFVGGAHTGIRIRGGDSILRGLTVNRFNVNQVHLITRGNNVLVGNHIGVNVAGDATAQSGTIANGIYVDNTPDNTIGGASAADRNVIAGNANGIYILGAGSVASNAARNNRILGNYIGTDAAGNADLGNASGVRVQTGHHNTIGGLMPGARNVISGNNVFGIILSGIGGTGLPLGSDNVIQGNYIGVNAAGTAPLANSTGIHLGLGNRQLVGGTVPGAGNLIANGNVGVKLDQTQDSRVQGNRIGTGPAGTEDWGCNLGIQFSSTSTNNLVGGRDEDDGTADGFVAAGNVIAFSDAHGVIALLTSANNRNAVLGNSIHSSASIGINLQGGDSPTLNGVTANDESVGPYDTDVGANGRQNFPVLTLVGNAAGSLHLEGTLKTAASTTYRLEFFTNPAPEVPSHHGEGRTYLGAANVTSDGTGLANFTGANALSLPVNLSGVQYLTATASPLAWDHDNNPATPLYPTSTSEFSAEYKLDAGTNNPPVATDATYTTTSGPLFGQPVNIDLRTLVSDVETADDDLIYEIVTQPNAVSPLPLNGFLKTIVPPGGFMGDITFTYKVTDLGSPALMSAVKTVTIHVQPLRPDVRVSLVTLGSAAQGEDLVYTIRAENHGPGETTTLQVDFQLPAELVRLGRRFEFRPQADLINVIPDAAHNATYQLLPALGGGISVAFHLGLPLRPVGEGDSATFTLVVRPLVVGKTITAQTSAITTPADLNPADNAVAVTTFIARPRSDVSIRFEDAPLDAIVGDEVTYRVVVANAGPQAARNVRAVSFLPFIYSTSTIYLLNSPFTFTVKEGLLTITDINASVGSTVDNQSGFLGPPRIEWNVGTLASGATATLTMRGPVRPDAVDGGMSLRVRVIADEPDPNRVNNTAVSKTTRVTAEPDLEVSMTNLDNGDVVKINGTVDYLINAQNNGPGTAKGVKLTVQLPLGVTFVRGPGPDGVGPKIGVEITPSNRTAFINVGTLKEGQTESFRLRFVPRATAQLTTSVSVSGNERDRIPDNNSVAKFVSVGPQIELIRDGKFDFVNSGLPSPWIPRGHVALGGKLTLMPGLREPEALVPRPRTAEQAVTIPLGVTVVALTFNLNIFDYRGVNQLRVELLDGLIQPALIVNDSSVDETFTFVFPTVPGTTVRLRFSAISGVVSVGLNPTTWSIDDVSLSTL